MKRHMTRILALRKIAAVSIVVLTMAVVYGCGGGGGGGGTDPQTDFPLYQLGFDLDPGFVASFTGSGTVTIEGTKYPITGSYSIEVLAGEVEALLHITGPDITDFSTRTTTYLNAQNEPTSQVIELLDANGIPLESDVLTPINYIPLPDSGRLGDSGEMTEWSYANGDTISGTWVLKNAQPGFINFEINYDYQDALQNLTGVETDTYTIDEAGSIESVKVIAHDFDEDIIIELSAKRDN